MRRQDVGRLQLQRERIFPIQGECGGHDRQSAFLFLATQIRGIEKDDRAPPSPPGRKKREPDI
jgi:hypothetical protein